MNISQGQPVDSKGIDNRSLYKNNNSSFLKSNDKNFSPQLQPNSNQSAQSWLGVIGIYLTKQISKISELKTNTGFLVIAVVNGSPMDNLNIKMKDVILKIDNKSVIKPGDIEFYIHMHKKIGDVMKITLLTDGKLKEIALSLSLKPTLFKYTKGFIIE